MRSGQERRVALVHNPVAGPNRGAEGEVVDALRAAFSHVEVFDTSPERDADVCAREALSTDPDVVVAAGGDGTVSMVASALVGTGKPLGIIARGTSNSIAGALGVPADLAGAVEVLRTGSIREVDTAVANGKTMVLHASIGVHAATIANTSREAKNRWGIFAYIADGIAQLAEIEPFGVEMETEARVIHCRASNIMVANLAPPKTILAQGPSVIAADDGALSVTIVAAESLAEAVATGIHLLRTAVQGEPATRDNVGYLTTRRIRIETTPEQQLLVDGEPAGSGRLEVHCLPRSLAVLVPLEALHPESPPKGESKLEGLPELDVEMKTGRPTDPMR